MLYSYKELKCIYKDNYQIQKLVNLKKISKIQEGLYSDKENVNDFEIISKKYPDAVFTMNTAYYIYDLIDVIPEKLELAVERDTIRIKNNKVKQIYFNSNLINLGKTQIDYMGAKINIYDKERLLLELIKNERKMPFNYYKEIINSYRKIAYELDIRKIEQYLLNYKNSKLLLKAIQKEVF